MSISIKTENEVAYEKCRDLAKSRQQWATYHAICEDGYVELVDWISMYAKWSSE